VTFFDNRIDVAAGGHGGPEGFVPAGWTVRARAQTYSSPLGEVPEGRIDEGVDARFHLAQIADNQVREPAALSLLERR
jgi:hypothetical protein